MANSFLTAMHAARRAGKASFEWKGKKYVRGKAKTGLIVYRKSGSARAPVAGKRKRKGSSIRSAGSITSAGSVSTAGRLKGGAMSEEARQVNKYGRRATVLARKATNTIVNNQDTARDIVSAMGGRVRRKRRKRKY